MVGRSLPPWGGRRTTVLATSEEEKTTSAGLNAMTNRIETVVANGGHDGAIRSEVMAFTNENGVGFELREIGDQRSKRGGRSPSL